MRIDVEIRYEAVCRPLNAQSYKGRFYENLALEITEAISQDAPVATETPDGKVTRWFNGNHYLPRVDLDRLESGNGKATAEALECIATTSLYGLNTGYDCFDKQVSRPVMFDPDRYVEFEHVKRDRAIDDAKRCLDHILLLDGELWVRCSEPYVIIEDYPVLSYDIPIDIGASRPNHRFRGRMFHATVVRADDERAASLVKVLIADSIRLEPEGETLVDAARSFLETYSYRHLWSIDSRIFSALAELLPAYQSSGCPGSDREVLVDPLLRVIEAVEAFETSDRVNGRTHIAACRRAVEAWLDRRVAVNDIVNLPSARCRL